MASWLVGCLLAWLRLDSHMQPAAAPKPHWAKAAAVVDVAAILNTPQSSMRTQMMCPTLFDPVVILTQTFRLVARDARAGNPIAHHRRSTAWVGWSADEAESAAAPRVPN